MIDIPAATTSINTYAWNHAYIRCFSVDSSNEKYASEKGFLMTKDKKGILRAPNNVTNLSDVPFFESVGGWAFTKSDMKNLTCPSSLNTINSGAFHAMYKLVYLDLSQTSITTIPGRFIESSAIKTLILPTSTAVIKENAFNTINFKRLIIPQTVSVIENNAFSKNAKLVIIYLGKEDFSNSLMFNETMNKQDIKVYVTDFYKQDKFGTIRVYRKWINEAITMYCRKSFFSYTNLMVVLLNSISYN